MWASPQLIVIESSTNYFEVYLDAFKVWAPLLSGIDEFKVWAPPFTLSVDDFKVWAPLYQLMILRYGLPLTLSVDEFEALALHLQYELMTLRRWPPFYTIY